MTCSPRPNAARYQGLFGAVFGISFIIGPLLGGLLTDNVSWHWIFYVNIPVGIVSLIVLARLLPTVKRAGATRNLDLPGAAVFTVAISALLVGLTNKQSGDWADPTVGGLILRRPRSSGPCSSSSLEARAKEPIIPLGLFRNRTYAASMLSTFLVSFGFFGAIIFLPRWFQFVHGFERDRIRLPDLPAAHRPDRQLDRLRHPRVEDRPLQVAIIVTGLVIMRSAVA